MTPFPLLVLGFSDYNIVKPYTNSTKHPHAKILKSEITRDDEAPQMVEFSSCGPNPINIRTCGRVDQHGPFV